MVTGGAVTLAGWPAESWQPVGRLTELLTALGAEVTQRDEAGLTVRGTGTLRGITADLSEVSELTPVLAALAALADGPSELRGVEHIRGHETDRIAALAAELAKVGAGRHRVPRRAADRPRAAARRAPSRRTRITGWRTPRRLSDSPSRASRSPT